MLQPSLSAPTPYEQVALSELEHTPLVMFRAGYDIRGATLEACRMAGFTPKFAVEGGEMDAVLAFVEAGLGVALAGAITVGFHPAVGVTVAIVLFAAFW